MTNNISVCFVSFASGIVAGLGTIFEMLMNGFLIGVIGVACFEANMSNMLWSFVAPHGVLELPAIFISGGAGLLLARGLLISRAASSPRIFGAGRSEKRPLDVRNHSDPHRGRND